MPGLFLVVEDAGKEFRIKSLLNDLATVFDPNKRVRLINWFTGFQYFVIAAYGLKNCRSIFMVRYLVFFTLDPIARVSASVVTKTLITSSMQGFVAILAVVCWIGAIGACIFHFR